jgi:hypothetical protein
LANSIKVAGMIDEFDTRGVCRRTTAPVTAVVPMRYGSDFFEVIPQVLPNETVTSDAV